MSTEAVLVALLAAAILSATPLMLAAVGEAVSEHSGLLNLGIEGTMLIAAFVAFRIALATGSGPLGLAGGAAAGALIGVGFGFLATVGKADQVVLGLGLTLAGAGGSAFMFRETWGSEQPLLSHGLGRPLDGLLDWLPVVGPALGQQSWFVYIAWLVPLGVHLFLRHTLPGLRIRAAGDAPLGLESVGGNLVRTRIMAATIGGTCSGLAGATLVVVELGFFTPGVTAGAGFLAVALAMLGRLAPIRVAILTLGFGVLTGLDTGLQIASVDVRSEFLRMVPYVGIVLALVCFGRGVRLPRALGQPYRGITSRQ
jgi:simple sugar transport system permease protein